LIYQWLNSLPHLPYLCILPPSLAESLVLILYSDTHLPCASALKLVSLETSPRFYTHPKLRKLEMVWSVSWIYITRAQDDYAKYGRKLYARQNHIFHLICVI